MLLLNCKKRSEKCKKQMCARIHVGHIIIKIQFILFIIASSFVLFPVLFQFYVFNKYDKIIPITIPFLVPNSFEAKTAEQSLSSALVFIGFLGTYCVESLFVVCCFNIFQYMEWHLHEIRGISEAILKCPTNFNRKQVSKMINSAIKGSQQMYMYVI